MPRPAEDAAPGQMTVQALDGAHVYFAGEMDNHRRGDADVTFPTGSWQNVTMRLRLRCPSNRCDYWDRWAYLTVVEGTAPNERLTEIMRFVTPYRLAADWTADVTALQPLLSGQRARCGCSSTPGSARATPRATAGWSTSASRSSPGRPRGDPAPVAVIPLWDVSQFEVGEPDQAARRRPARSHGGDPRRAPARSSCARSSPATARATCRTAPSSAPRPTASPSGSMRFDRRVWRADCATTAVPNQPGTWQYFTRRLVPRRPGHPLGRGRDRRRRPRARRSP